MIDSHCHLDASAFDTDRAQVWQRALAQGVRAVLVPGTEPSRWADTAAQHDGHTRFVALGLHPRAVLALDEGAVRDGLHGLAHALRDARAVALGECGLEGSARLAQQRSALEAQCETARALALPLVVHVVHAHGEALAFFKRCPLGPEGAVLHGYSGDAALIEPYAKLGFHFSFGAALTRPKARRVLEAARAVPLHRLLVETDAPEQAPWGAGPRGEPAQLGLVLARLAQLRGASPEALAAQTARNAVALFRLPAGLCEG